MRNIKEAENLKGKKVLLRLDLNVPVKDGEVIDDFRIKKVLPTINFLIEQGARIIILSHIGREKEDTLKPVFDYLKNLIEISFVEDIFGKETLLLVENMSDGQVLMFENLRKYNEESLNDDSFTKRLAVFGDIYVNDSFATSHRKHASIVGLPKYLPSFSGILFNEEIKKLSQSFDPPKPAVFILGGNKFNTKLPLINKIIDKADFVFIGGALANYFYKEQGLNVGRSVIDEGDFSLKELMKNKKLILPTDVVVQDSTGKVFTKKPSEVLDDEIIFDAGPETTLILKKIMKNVEFILFNGPLGDYKRGFDKSTSDLIKNIAESDAESIVGGGDTVTIISKLKLEDCFGFVSTGGGAMLDFLMNENLPGIEALENNQN